jgi:hypothetical protein
MDFCIQVLFLSSPHGDSGGLGSRMAIAKSEIVLCHLGPQQATVKMELGGYSIGLFRVKLVKDERG